MGVKICGVFFWVRLIFYGDDRGREINLVNRVFVFRMRVWSIKSEFLFVFF